MMVLVLGIGRTAVKLATDGINHGTHIVNSGYDASCVRGFNDSFSLEA
jgi:hypothetical protein